MSESIRVTLARETDSRALMSYLSDHGFVVHRAAADDGTVLDVDRPPTQGLDAAVWDALTSWLATSRRPLVPVALHEHEYALAPPGE